MISQNQVRGSGVILNKKVLSGRLGDGSAISKQDLTVRQIMFLWLADRKHLAELRSGSRNEYSWKCTNLSDKGVFTS